jgi:hypothetical protein
MQARSRRPPYHPETAETVEGPGDQSRRTVRTAFSGLWVGRTLLAKGSSAPSAGLARLFARVGVRALARRRFATAPAQLLGDERERLDRSPRTGKDDGPSRTPTTESAGWRMSHAAPGGTVKTMSPREGDGRRGRRRLIVTEEL